MNDRNYDFVESAVDELRSADRRIDELEDALDAARSKAAEWIPVSERLPEDGEWVLWFNQSWSQPTVVAKRDGESLDWGGDLNCALSGFTHWMPLPEPPQVTP